MKSPKGWRSDAPDACACRRRAKGGDFVRFKGKRLPCLRQGVLCVTGLHAAWIDMPYVYDVKIRAISQVFDLNQMRCVLLSHNAPQFLCAPLASCERRVGRTQVCLAASALALFWRFGRSDFALGNLFSLLGLGCVLASSGAPFFGRRLGRRALAVMYIRLPSEAVGYIVWIR
jgi:hypothetical protein